MRRLFVLLALIAPLLVLIYFRLQPAADVTLAHPIFHFYIVSFASIAASTVGFLLVVALERVARPRHQLVAVAFAVMGAFFAMHGLTTPGAILPFTHPAVPAVSWSAWLTLFSGGAIFALAGLDRPLQAPRQWLSRLIAVAVAVVIAYISIVVVVPHWLVRVEELVAPWHRIGLFAVTIVLWLLAALQLTNAWRITKNSVDGSLAFVAAWMAQATISLHLFPLWNLSWWSYHFVLLVGFLFTARILFSRYEQARRFRLIGYYLAAAVIMTALLALLSSHLFGRVAQAILSQEILLRSEEVVAGFVDDTFEQFVRPLTASEAVTRYAERLPTLAMSGAAIYDRRGRAIIPATAPPITAQGEHGEHHFGAALAGTGEAHVHAPGDIRDSYGAAGAYHWIEVFTPLPGTDGKAVGVLVSVVEAPQLTGYLLQARAAGLAISGLTMGLLFLSLFAVVRRGERIINTRTMELREAYRDVQRAEAMRDDLMHMIVHDLRTPLTAISTSLDLLHRLSADGLSDVQQRVVRRTRLATKRLGRLIDDILAVAQIEIGDLWPQREHVRLQEALVEWLEVFEARAVSEGKVLAIECPPEVVAYLDANLTGRVLENLVNNAFKYTGARGTITVSASSEDSSVIISVRDNGEGVPDEFKEHIFRKFAQVPENRAANVRKGTGLGLAFCRLVAESHGGRIWVEDAPGGGSDFLLEIPNADGADNGESES